MKHFVLKSYLISSIIFVFFICMMALAIFSVRYKSVQFSGDVMLDDMVLLAHIVHRAQKDAHMLCKLDVVESDIGLDTAQELFF